MHRAPFPRRFVSPPERRALINGVTAAVITAVIGFTVVANTGGHETPSASPTRTTSPSSSPPACVPVYETLPSADPKDGGNLLLGVSVIAPNDGWAVGGSGDPSNPTLTLYERWDGATWSAVDGPNPGTIVNELFAVDEMATDDAWAVGRTGSGSGDQPLITHFDGLTWTVQSGPVDVTSGALYGVAAAATDDVWAVGSTGDAATGSEQALALRFDGITWTASKILPAVGSGRSLLSGVSALAPNNVWAVGYHHNRPLILHFDGISWTQSTTDAQGSLRAVSAVAVGEVWALGTHIQHFAGVGWGELGRVHGDGELIGVAPVSPEDVWAVGSRTVSPTEGRALVQRWDGARWASVQGNRIAGSAAALTAVSALADGTVIAVGYRDTKQGRATVAIRGVDCPPTG